MNDGNVTGNLLKTPLEANAGLNPAPQALRNLYGIATVAGALSLFAAGLLSSVTLCASAKLDTRTIVPQYSAERLAISVVVRRLLARLLIWYLSSRLRCL